MSILILLTAIIFYYIGKYSQTDIEKQTIKRIKYSRKIKPGAIKFKTPEDFEDEKSGDKELESEWLRSGKDKLIKL